MEIKIDLIRYIVRFIAVLAVVALVPINVEVAHVESNSSTKKISESITISAFTAQVKAQGGPCVDCPPCIDCGGGGGGDGGASATCSGQCATTSCSISGYYKNGCIAGGCGDFCECRGFDENDVEVESTMDFCAPNV